MHKTIVFILALLLIAPANAQKDSSARDILAAFHQVQLSMNKAGANIDEMNKSTLENWKREAVKIPPLAPTLTKQHWHTKPQQNLWLMWKN